MTALLSTPNSFASSYTRTFATTLLLGPVPWTPYRDPGPGRACSGPASAYGDHRRVLIERSSASRPAFRQVFLLALKPAAQPGCSAASNVIPGIVRRKGTQPVVRG